MVFKIHKNSSVINSAPSIEIEMCRLQRTYMRASVYSPSRVADLLLLATGTGSSLLGLFLVLGWENRKLVVGHPGCLFTRMAVTVAALPAALRALTGVAMFSLVAPLRLLRCPSLFMAPHALKFI